MVQRYEDSPAWFSLMLFRVAVDNCQLYLHWKSSTDISLPLFPAFLMTAARHQHFFLALLGRRIFNYYNTQFLLSSPEGLGLIRAQRAPSYARRQGWQGPLTSSSSLLYNLTTRILNTCECLARTLSGSLTATWLQAKYVIVQKTNCYCQC